MACTKATEKNIVVTNGDTLFKIDLHKATMFHNHNNAECTLLLKPMNRFDRYGVVELDEEQLVNSFKEKQFYETGNINGGVYLLNKDKFLDEEFPAKFSLISAYRKITTVHNQSSVAPHLTYQLLIKAGRYLLTGMV